MLSTALRGVDPVLAATDKATVPFPVTGEPDVIVTKPALLDALHVQPVFDRTDTDGESAEDSTESVFGLPMYAHETGACITVNVYPRTVREPVRTTLSGFGPREYATVPVPETESPDVM